MIKTKQIIEPNKTSEICHSIFRELPEWFGIEDALLDYVEKVKSMLFFVAYDVKKAVGFITLKKHNDFTQKIYVMGIIERYHRQKFGTQLFEECVAVCRLEGSRFLTVKTLDKSAKNVPYAKKTSILMYDRFLPYRSFPFTLGPENPCMFMAKYLDSV